MENLQISPDFTVEDIHKIREWNYEKRKNMTFEEYLNDVEKGANEALKKLAEL
ncbi:MAG: hypothetical protein LBN20_06195 [Endomicrobium sp.]|jgi:hypothetical protein|nr:hypothetical protein [Endomicrobium sp.]